MSVVKSKRKPSRFEVEHNAFKIRTVLLKDILVDYGVMNREQLIPQLQQILYESTPHLLNYARQISNCIQSANALYGINIEMMNERRKWQDRAIAYCNCILQEFQYIIAVLNDFINVNKYKQITELVNTEIILIKGWRKADNKIRKQLESKLSSESSSD